MEAQNVRLKEIGPWSEQYSSSGKRYYYNRETEVSQWEKPTEWKQAEKEHGERAKYQGSNKDHEKNKYRPKQTSAQNQTGSTCKQPDPTIPNNKMSSQSLTSSDSTKRARLNDSSSPSTQNKKTPTTNQQESSSGELFHHHSDSQKQGREKYKSTMSLPTSSVQHQIDDFNKSCHDMKLASAIGGDQDKSVALLNSSSTRSKHSTSYQNLTSPTKNGKLSSPQKSKNCDNGHGIETVAVGFREDKYTNFYSPDSGSTIKRGISSEYPNDLKKFAERNLRHTNTLFSIDQDLYSIQILMKTAEFRTQLLTQRIGATSKRIQELESK